MQALWFKQQYVASILDGSKRSTLRARKPTYLLNEIVPASVGPRRPFALLRIKRVISERLCDLTESERTSLAALYPHAELIYRIVFELHERLEDA